MGIGQWIGIGVDKGIRQLGDQIGIIKQNIHKECFNAWSKSSQQSNGEILCVYCRAPWIQDNQNHNKSHSKINQNISLINQEGYMNLGYEQGQSQIRDTSSYHWNFHGSDDDEDDYHYHRYKCNWGRSYRRW